MRSMLLPCLAVLLVTAPATGLAQESAGHTPDAPRAFRSAQLVPKEAPAAEPGSSSRAGRIISGAIVGSFGAALGGVAGLLGGGALSDRDCSLFNSCSLMQAPKPYLGFMLGSALAGSIAYYAVGSNWNGRGHFLPTLFGATAAVGLFSMPVFAGALDQDRLLLSPLVAAAGAAIAYEISHASNDPASASQEVEIVARRSESSDVHVVPVLGATQGGGLLGLAGTF